MALSPDDILVKGNKAAVVDVEKVAVNAVAVAKPKGKQVVVKVTHAGVCHSDVHCFTHSGVYGMFPFPQHPGHEILGEVFAHGPEVGDAEAKEAPVGSKVLVYPWITCDNCSRCDAGNFNWCTASKNSIIGGARGYENGYAEYVTVTHPKFLVRAEGIDESLATILPCAGLTSYSAVKESQTREKSTSDGVLAIVGCGGLGLMGIQFAKKLSKQNIVAIDVNDEALKVAKECGADFVINSKTTKDVAKHIRELPVSNTTVEAIIDYVNSPTTHTLASSLCVRGTHLIMIGLAGGTTETNLLRIPLQARQVTGIFVGSLPDLKELVALARRDGDLKSNVMKNIKLEDVGTALMDLKLGRIRGRQMIVMG